jgi:hypothetical protein
LVSLSANFLSLSGTVAKLSDRGTGLLEALTSSNTIRSDAIMSTLGTRFDRLDTRLDSVHDLASLTSTTVDNISKVVRDAVVRTPVDAAAAPVPVPPVPASNPAPPVPASEAPASTTGGGGAVPASIPNGNGGDTGCPSGTDGAEPAPFSLVSGGVVPAGSTSASASLGLRSSPAGQTFLDEVTDLVSGLDHDTIVDPSASSDRLFDVDPDFTIGESDIELEEEFLRTHTPSEAGPSHLFSEEEYEEDESEKDESEPEESEEEEEEEEEESEEE